MQLAELKREAAKRSEAILVEDIRAGLLWLNDPAQKLLGSCGDPNPVCLMCRMHPHDAARMLALRDKLFKGQCCSANGTVRFQCAPGVQELLEFSKLSFGKRFAVSVLSSQGIIGRCSDHVKTEIQYESGR